jgi:hypothetical protein
MARIDVCLSSASTASIKMIKAIFPIEGESAPYHAAIEHEGRMWLVPTWLPFPGEGYTKPERMIPIDQFQHQLIEAGNGDQTVMINVPLPRSLFDGLLSPELKARFGVLERPEAKFRMAPGSLN